MAGLLDHRAILHIIQRTLDCLDTRLMAHGTRVAYLVYEMGKVANLPEDKLEELCFTALLHDIGAFKTDEIDDLLAFDGKEVWQHAIYGSLYLKYFSPISEYAPVLLYHHATVEQLKQAEGLTEQTALFAQMIFLADRADVYLGQPKRTLERFYRQLEKDRRFSKEVKELFLNAQILMPVSSAIREDEAFVHFMDQITLSKAQIDQYLEMIVHVIDFRSFYTMTHTMTTTSVSIQLADMMKLPGVTREKIAYGALLHDLGKVKIPLSILESPGRLTTEQMEIMKAHVDYTAEILGTEIDEEIIRIALRHHEKLNGGGYPEGLSAGQLTVPERIVAVADITSALYGVRSYKEAYPKEGVVTVLRKMGENGLIDKNAVALVCDHFEEIAKNVEIYTAPAHKRYEQMTREFKQLQAKFADLDGKRKPQQNQK